MIYMENALTYEDYFKLRESAGWLNFSREQAQKAISNSVYTIIAMEQNEIVGMGRLIGDGMYYIIADIVVRPDFQNREIGTKIMDMLMAFVTRETPVGGRSSIHKARGTAFFQCSSCHAKQETIPCGTDDIEINAQCTTTGRYFGAALPKNKIHGQKANVKCPYCGELVAGNVIKQEGARQIVFRDVRNAKDPYFQYPLYFQTQYRGKVIWALNREHLRALIDYLSADIRMDLETTDFRFDQLPTFMKTAKNRDKIVKLFMKLWEK